MGIEAAGKAPAAGRLAWNEGALPHARMTRIEDLDALGPSS